MFQMPRAVIALAGFALTAATLADAIIQSVPMAAAPSPARAAAMLVPATAPAPRPVALSDHRAGFVNRNAPHLLGKPATFTTAGGLGWG